MLWCRQTFQESFDETECQLFSTQKQLFAFIDTAASRAGEEVLWLPFSIELLSELEVTERLSSCGSRRENCGGRSGLFRRVEKPAASSDENTLTTRQNTHEPLRKRPRNQLATRQSFSLLYGETPLSAQSRMFVAATFKGVEKMLRSIEPAQLHLYEIIREGSPCHLYFDVERDGDVVGLQEEVVISSSDSEVESEVVSGEATPPKESLPLRVASVEQMGRHGNSIVTATLHTRSGTRQFRSTRSEYQTLLAEVAKMPNGTCPLDCPITPDNSRTSHMLLSELDNFIRQEYCFLLGYEEPPVERVADAKKSALLPLWAKSILVMDSVPLHGMHSAKFSQHYVVQLRHHVFDTNLSVGAFVRHFVQFLESKCDGGSVSVHESLFFHGAHVQENVLRTLSAERPSAAVPFFARKCVIDAAVYSRNRMMRCLGSCKLHKTNCLQVNQWLSMCTSPDDASSAHGRLFSPITALMLWNSLITARADEPHDLPSLLHVEASESRRPGFDPSAMHRPTLACAAPLETGEMQSASTVDEASLVEKLESQYRCISGCAACSVGESRRIGNRYLAFTVHGTRFCQNVMREHKSNGVYLVVDAEKHTWVQKCFDPDCAQFRSAAIPLNITQRM